MITQIPIWLDLTAILLGALAGAMAGRRQGFDVAGTVFLAISCGVGGGILRDTVLQAGPPVALVQPALLPTTIVAGLVVHYLGHVVDRATPVATRRFDLAFVLLDSGSLALYGIIGAAKAHQFGLPVVSCIAVGVLAGTGGVIIRDVVVNEPPQLFLPGSLYALAAAFGCTVFLACQAASNDGLPSAIAGAATIIAIRAASYLRGWSTRPARQPGPRLDGERSRPGR